MDKGYYETSSAMVLGHIAVAIHNKNGQGLLLKIMKSKRGGAIVSQSTIKMDKGYYQSISLSPLQNQLVAIHNKNGQGLLPYHPDEAGLAFSGRNPQ